jgi:hypothetical protein
VELDAVQRQEALGVALAVEGLGTGAPVDVPVAGTPAHLPVAAISESTATLLD